MVFGSALIMARFILVVVVALFMGSLFLMTSLIKNLQPPSKKLFFDCRLEDLLHLLRLLPGL